MCVLLLPLKNSVALALSKSLSLIFQAQLCLVEQTGSPGVHQLGACEGIKTPKASGFQNLLAYKMLFSREFIYRGVKETILRLFTAEMYK